MKNLKYKNQITKEGFKSGLIDQKVLFNSNTIAKMYLKDLVFHVEVIDGFGNNDIKKVDYFGIYELRKAKKCHNQNIKDFS